MEYIASFTNPTVSELYAISRYIHIHNPEQPFQLIGTLPKATLYPEIAILKIPGTNFHLAYHILKLLPQPPTRCSTSPCTRPHSGPLVAL